MKISGIKYILLIILASVFSFSYSQNVEVSGKVMDSIGNSIELANIIAINQTTNKLTSYSITDESGKFKLNLFVDNSYNIKISFLGYKTINKVIKVVDSNKIIKDYIMYEDQSILDDVTLTYELPVTIKGDTIIYNADSFNTGTEKKLKDVMKILPGVEINDLGQIEVEGKQVTKLMVEGKDFFDGDTKLAIENIPSNAVDKVEVLKKLY